jgi:hypothetical protein
MATPLSLIQRNRRRNTFYADDVPHIMHRSYHDYIYEEVIAQFPDDPVGYRRLVHRDFSNVRGMLICTEHTVARVAAQGYPSDWSLDVTLFRTHTVPPVRWNENNVSPPHFVHLDDITDLNTQSSSVLLLSAQLNCREELENEVRMNRIQDELSRIPDA